MNDAPLDSLEFLAFDLETTGLHAVSCKIIEVGAVRFRTNGEVIGTFNQMVDPECEIPEETTLVHGISDSDVKGKPTIDKVLPQFIDFVGEPPVRLLAHSARFDVEFLSVAMGRFETAIPAHPIYDTCNILRKHVKLENYKLETAGQHWKLIDKERHRAFEDALLLKDVFLALLRDNRHLVTLRDVLGWLSVGALKGATYGRFRRGHF